MPSPRHWERFTRLAPNYVQYKSTTRPGFFRAQSVLRWCVRAAAFTGFDECSATPKRTMETTCWKLLKDAGPTESCQFDSPLNGCRWSIYLGDDRCGLSAGGTGVVSGCQLSPAQSGKSVGFAIPVLVEANRP